MSTHVYYFFRAACVIIFDMADGMLTAGNKVARLGEHFRITQEAWAAELGVSRGTVAAYKARDNASPKTEKIRELSSRFGIPIDWFYNGEDDAPPVPRDMDQAELLAGDGHVIAQHPSRQTNETRRFAENLEVLLPVWQGIVAGLNEECSFPETKVAPPQSVPSYFLSGKSEERFIVCLPTGVSMSPRIVQGDRVIVRLEPNPDPNTIVVARRPDGVNFIKVFRIVDGVPELHSINENFPVISLLEDWTCRGVVVGIWKPYIAEGPNIEFNGGTPLRS
ncbi:MAG: helix-turn-helix domain-containing protein [Fimbriimonas sp.]